MRLNQPRSSVWMILHEHVPFLLNHPLYTHRFAWQFIINPGRVRDLRNYDEILIVSVSEMGHLRDGVQFESTSPIIFPSAAGWLNPTDFHLFCPFSPVATSATSNGHPRAGRQIVHVSAVDVACHVAARGIGSLIHSETTGKNCW